MRAFLLAAVLLAAPALAGPGPIYSNITNFGGDAFSHGNSILADDLTLDRTGTTGSILQEVTFTLANLDTNTLADVVAEVFFFADSAGAPGAVLDSFSVNLAGINLPSFNLTTVGVDVSGLAIDTTGWDPTVWAGLRFSNARGVTDINNLGQGFFNPPTKGSSADVVFLEGTGLIAFGGNPVANLGWELVVPEPATLGLLLVGAFGLIRRR